ncbi:hypothetical protein O181_077076, partial [Austropuccinia psidii MF-1]|nr:hypothetical protein [Austropuccinia psidii MF-1]
MVTVDEISASTSSTNREEAQVAVDETRALNPVDSCVAEPLGLVDESQSSGEPTSIPSSPVRPLHRSRIKVIGPRHPTLITADITPANILPYSRRAGALVTIAPDAPQTYKKAVEGSDKQAWLESISKELQSMERLKVWDVVELDPSYKLVGTTWVFKLKQNHLNKVVEHKARLCAQGFTQVQGVDFEKTYSPTGRLNSLRTLIAFAATTGLQFHQVDVKSAFLNAPLSETVFLSIPQGLCHDRRKTCLRLNKAIYGLKQAPLAWYQRLKDWLVKKGFTSCILDPCVFYRKGKHPIWLYVHVDDIAIFGKFVDDFKSEIAEDFEIKDIGIADLMLGVKIGQDENHLSLDQQHFTDSLLHLYGMDNCKPVSTPLVPNQHLLASTDKEEAEFKALGINYRSAIGSINYLSTATQPDLSFAVSSLSQFLERPGIQHWKAFLHVLRYLRGTDDLGLVYSRSHQPGIRAYSDADWGNCRKTHRSITGYLTTFNDCLVLWKTRKEPAVSLSTSEAEYKSLCDLTSKLLWLCQWCEEAGLLLDFSPIPVHEDNQGCISTANGDSSINGKHMKHVDIQLHFVKEAIKTSRIRLVYTPTNDMLADFLTKSTPRTALCRALKLLGVVRLG